MFSKHSSCFVLWFILNILFRKLWKILKYSINLLKVKIQLIIFLVYVNFVLNQFNNIKIFKIEARRMKFHTFIIDIWFKFFWKFQQIWSPLPQTVWLQIMFPAYLKNPTIEWNMRSSISNLHKTVVLMFILHSTH